MEGKHYSSILLRVVQRKFAGLGLLSLASPKWRVCRSLECGAVFLSHIVSILKEF